MLKRSCNFSRAKIERINTVARHVLLQNRRAVSDLVRHDADMISLYCSFRTSGVMQVTQVDQYHFLLTLGGMSRKPFTCMESAPHRIKWKYIRIKWLALQNTILLTASTNGSIIIITSTDYLNVIRIKMISKMSVMMRAQVDMEIAPNIEMNSYTTVSRLTGRYTTVFQDWQDVIIP